MKLRKFTARTMKEAIAEVKTTLGPDAMIVATREVRRGVLGSAIEVTAAIEEDVKKPVEIEPAKPAPASAAITDEDVERIMAPLRSELRSIRAQIPVVQPARDEQRIDHELSSMRAAIARLAGRIEPAKVNPTLSTIAKSSPIAAPPMCRAIAVLGPTGAGKTTTIAKIAAREALVARKSVALITLDTYRIGGEDQIRIFADLIGVPLAVVQSLDELPRAFHQLSSYDRVLIDTAGRSPRDRATIDDTTHALRRIADLEIHLAIPAATQPGTIDALIDRFGAANIDRLLFTKLDEATDLSELVEAPSRNQRPISFVTTGQRVPEDLEEATWSRLLSFAEKGFEAVQLKEVAA